MNWVCLCRADYNRELYHLMILLKISLKYPAPVWFLVMLAVLSGCTMPPDLVSPPQVVPRPDIELDSTLSGEPPIDSSILSAARGDPDGHKAVLLEEGESSLIARIHLIRAARESIDLQTFIYVYDDSGSWVFQELLAAARRGVRVRLLVDHIMSPNLSAEAYAGLASAHKNLEIRLFRPFAADAVTDPIDYTQNTFIRFSTMNYRMHNKVFLVDSQVAIIGGRNIQDAYYDRDPELCFTDRDVIVSGPSIGEIQSSFDTFWNHEETYEALCMKDVSAVLNNGNSHIPQSITGPIPATYTELDILSNQFDLATVRPDLRIWEVSNIRFITDEPVKVSKFANPWKQNPFDEIYSLIEDADEEILMQTPYSVIENKTYDRFRKIRKAKPDVRFILSTNSLSSADHFFVGGMAMKQRRFQIEGLKFELYLAKPVPEDIREMASRYDLLLETAKELAGNQWWIQRNLFPTRDPGPRFCMHSKSLVLDESVCLIGSHNFDPRSVYLNSECMVIIEDPAFSKHVAGYIRRMIHPRNSWVVAPRDLPPVIGELNSLITLLTSNLPLFDIWPLEHVSCYELKEGEEPVPPGHPDFYDRYNDVGPLPGLDLGLEQIRAMLVRSFAGPTIKLM